MSQSLRPVIPLPWDSPSSPGWDPAWLFAPGMRLDPRAPSPSPGDLHPGSAQRPLPNQEYRPRAGPPGRIDPSKARDLKMSNLPFPRGRRGRGPGGGRLGGGQAAGHRPGACALNEKRPGHVPALTLRGHPWGAVSSEWGQEVNPTPSPHFNRLHCCTGVFSEEQRRPPPPKVGRQIWKRSVSIGTFRHKEDFGNQDIKPPPRDSLAIRKSKSKGRGLKDTLNKTGDQRSRITPTLCLVDSGESGLGIRPGSIF